MEGNNSQTAASKPRGPAAWENGSNKRTITATAATTTATANKQNKTTKASPSPLRTSFNNMYTFITINIVAGILGENRGREIVSRFTKYLHKDNIEKVWNAKKKLGPTFLIKKSALDKARNFINTARLSFDIKIDQSDVLPSYRTNKGKTFYSKKTPSEVQNKPQNPTSNKGTRASTKPSQPKPSKKNHSTGILYNVPINIDMGTLKQELLKANKSIKSVHRIMNKKKRPTKIVKVTFNCFPAPLTLQGETSYEVNPCRVPYLRCSLCQAFGHTNKNCPVNKQICPLCTRNHTLNDCPVKEYKRAYTCANCNGEHGALYSQCPVFLRYKSLVDAHNKKTKQEWKDRRQQQKTVPTNVRTEQAVPPSKNPSSLENKSAYPALTKATETKAPQKIEAVIILDTPPASSKKPESMEEKNITKSDLKRILCELLTTDIMSKPTEERIKLIEQVVDTEFPQMSPEEPLPSKQVTQEPQPGPSSMETEPPIMMGNTQGIVTPLKTSTPRWSATPSSRFKSSTKKNGPPPKRGFKKVETKSRNPVKKLFPPDALEYLIEALGMKDLANSQSRADKES